MEMKRQVYRALDRAGGRLLLSVLATLIVSVKNLRPTFVYRVGSKWIHGHSAGVLVEREIHLATIGHLDSMTRDHWFHEYTPRAGDVIVDVGAGTGWEALLCARLVGPTGKVIAIEAHPETYACLSEMVRRNKLDNVIPIHCALTDEDGVIIVSDGGGHQGNTVVAAEGRGIEVSASRLDSLCSRLGVQRIDLLKMNIEGAEKYAVAGFGGMADVIRHAVISCHDFRAEWGHGEEFRSRELVSRELDRQGFSIRSRSEDSRSWVRDFLYASRGQSAPSAEGSTT